MKPIYHAAIETNHQYEGAGSPVFDAYGSDLVELLRLQREAAMTVAPDEAWKNGKSADGMPWAEYVDEGVSYHAYVEQIELIC